MENEELFCNYEHFLKINKIKLEKKGKDKENQRKLETFEHSLKILNKNKRRTHKIGREKQQKKEENGKTEKQKRT